MIKHYNKTHFTYIWVDLIKWIQEYNEVPCFFLGERTQEKGEK